MTTHIALAQVAGTDLSGRARARALRDAVVAAAPVVLDFSGVVCVSDSFHDELFGVLVLERGSNWFRSNITVKSLAPSIRRDLLAAVRARLDSKVRPSRPCEAVL
jgi:hypothetical protein